MAVRPIRAAMVGCGDVAAIHLEAIAAIEDASLVAVCDTDPDALARAVALTGAPGFVSVKEMLDAVPVDVVHVTTPHDQHVPVTLECLDAGVHVLQEKPLAASLDEAQRLVDAAATASTKIGICFQNRYNVSSQQLRRLLDSGELGEVRGAYASVVWTRTPDYYTAKPWRGSSARSGGGLLINQAIHTLDLLQWFLGEVDAVRGHVATDKFGGLIDVEDTAQLLLTHQSGATTSFYGTLTAPQHRPVEIELDCEHAYVTLRNGLTVDWRDGRPADQSQPGSSRADQSQPGSSRADQSQPRSTDHYAERAAASAGRSYWGVSHELLIRDFYSSLDAPEPFWISPAEALKSLRILKDAYAASAS